MGASNKETIINVYSEDSVVKLIRWLRNCKPANALLDCTMTKDSGNIATEEEILELFIASHNTTTRDLPIGYSIFRNSEN